jgi:hypothetical protein
VIATVTLNPALDKSMSIPGFAAGRTNRASIGRVEAGGKGINVAKALKQLGCPVVALGLLAAYALFGKGNARSSSPGAILIQFFGGIHEMYFPYVLMNPFTILALIAGGFSAATVFVATHAGLVATPSPGSILAEIAMSPKGGLFPVILGIGVSALVSFAIAAPIVSRAGGDAPLPVPAPGARPEAAVRRPRSELPPHTEVVVAHGSLVSRVADKG